MALNSNGVATTAFGNQVQWLLTNFVKIQENLLLCIHLKAIYDRRHVGVATPLILGRSLALT
jgi:hypothetical protein